MARLHREGERVSETPNEITEVCPRCQRFVLYTLEADGEVDGPSDCPHCDAALDTLQASAEERLRDMAVTRNAQVAEPFRGIVNGLGVTR